MSNNITNLTKVIQSLNMQVEALQRQAAHNADKFAKRIAVIIGLNDQVKTLEAQIKTLEDKGHC